MASLLCDKSLKGTVKVHDKEGRAEMQALGSADTQNIKLGTTYMPRPQHHLQKKTQDKGQDSDTSNCFSLSLSATRRSGSGYLSNTGTQKKPDLPQTVEKIHKEIESGQSLYKPLLEEEKTLVKGEVEQSLQHADMLALRKREMLHKTWSSRVFEPIHRQVLQAVSSPAFADRDRRHRELYHQYLEYTNKKGHVFLDTMDKGEYYAQALNGHRPAPITVYTPSLNDPLHLQKRERNREEQTILRCTTGEVYSLNDIDQINLPPMPLVPLGRHNANCVTWLEMPLGNIVSTPRKASR